MTDEAERRALIRDLMDSPVDPWPILDMLLRHQGPSALTTDAMRRARDVQRALSPAPETPGEGGT